MTLEANVHELAQVLERITSLEVAVAERESQILNVRAKAQVVLTRAREATRLADLAFTCDGELCPAFIHEICEKFVHTVQIRQLFYNWIVPMI